MPESRICLCTNMSHSQSNRCPLRVETDINREHGNRTKTQKMLTLNYVSRYRLRPRAIFTDINKRSLTETQKTIEF